MFIEENFLQHVTLITLWKLFWLCTRPLFYASLKTSDKTALILSPKWIVQSWSFFLKPNQLCVECDHLGLQWQKGLTNSLTYVCYTETFFCDFESTGWADDISAISTVYVLGISLWMGRWSMESWLTSSGCGIWEESVLIYNSKRIPRVWLRQCVKSEILVINQWQSKTRFKAVKVRSSLRVRNSKTGVQDYEGTTSAYEAPVSLCMCRLYIRASGVNHWYWIYTSRTVYCV